MCRRLRIQFVKRFGFLFGPNIVPLWSQIFGSNIFPIFLLHRGTIFGPNKIPNRLTNWMCRRRLKLYPDVHLSTHKDGRLTYLEKSLNLLKHLLRRAMKSDQKLSTSLGVLQWAIDTSVLHNVPKIWPNFSAVQSKLLLEIWWVSQQLPESGLKPGKNLNYPAKFYPPFYA